VNLALMAVLAATGTWTGNQRSDGDSISCQYEIGAWRDWRVFPFSNACPLTAELLSPAEQRRSELTQRLTEARAAQPSAGWYVPTVTLTALGALGVLFGFAFDNFDRCPLWHSPGPCRGFDLTRSSWPTLASWIGGSFVASAGAAFFTVIWHGREPANQLERELAALPAN
jgi:hypothetical protein